MTIKKNVIVNIIFLVPRMILTLFDTSVFSIESVSCSPISRMMHSCNTFMQSHNLNNIIKANLSLFVALSCLNYSTNNHIKNIELKKNNNNSKYIKKILDVGIYEQEDFEYISAPSGGPISNISG